MSRTIRLHALRQILCLLPVAAISCSSFWFWLARYNYCDYSDPIGLNLSEWLLGKGIIEVLWIAHVIWYCFERQSLIRYAYLQNFVGLVAMLGWAGLGALVIFRTNWTKCWDTGQNLVMLTYATYLELFLLVQICIGGICLIWFPAPSRQFRTSNYNYFVLNDNFSTDKSETRFSPPPPPPSPESSLAESDDVV